jgi:hypothetical protein
MPRAFRSAAVALIVATMGAATMGAATLGAQQAVYRRLAGDTLRYRNTTKMEGVVHGAAGDAPFTLSRDATFAFAFGGGESVTAWYDALAIEASGALGGEKSNPELLLRLPFRLHMEPNGRVVTVKAPELPRTARLIAELPPQLDDFFPRLPANGDVTIGTAWIDTATRVERDSAGHHLSIRRISHYRATRDSVVGGRPVVVITQHVDVRITSTSPMHTQPYITALALSGDEDGVALFCVAEGRLLERDRTGELHGAVTYRGGDEPWVVNQTYRYHRTDVLTAAPHAP